MKYIVVTLVLCSALSIPRASAVAQSHDREDSLQTFRLVQASIEQEDRGNFDSAIVLDKAILVMRPNMKEALNTIAGLYGKKADYYTEIEWAKKALAVDPTYVPAYINYGNAFAGLGSLDSAREEFNTAATLAPSNPLPLYSLGVVAESKQDIQTAIGYYRRSVQVDPKFASGYYNLAMMQANMGNFSEARTNLQKVLELNPRDDQTRGVLEEMRDQKDHPQR